VLEPRKVRLAQCTTVQPLSEKQSECHHQVTTMVAYCFQAADVAVNRELIVRGAAAPPPLANSLCEALRLCIIHPFREYTDHITHSNTTRIQQLLSRACLTGMC